MKSFLPGWKADGHDHPEGINPVPVQAEYCLHHAFQRTPSLFDIALSAVGLESVFFHKRGDVSGTSMLSAHMSHWIS